ncbi:MAG: hypothetical protein VW378_06360 [bacterium]
MVGSVRSVRHDDRRRKKSRRLLDTDEESFFSTPVDDIVERAPNSNDQSSSYSVDELMRRTLGI